MDFDPAAYIEELRAKFHRGIKSDELLETAKFRKLAAHVSTKYREPINPEAITHLHIFGILVEPFNPEPVTLFERTSDEVKSLTRQATPQEVEVLSVWDPRTWITTEHEGRSEVVKGWKWSRELGPHRVEEEPRPQQPKRIDKIAKF